MYDHYISKMHRWLTTTDINTTVHKTKQHVYSTASHHSLCQGFVNQHDIYWISIQNQRQSTRYSISMVVFGQVPILINYYNQYNFLWNYMYINKYRYVKLITKHIHIMFGMITEIWYEDYWVETTVTVWVMALPNTKLCFFLQFSVLAYICEKANNTPLAMRVYARGGSCPPDSGCT